MKSTKQVRAWIRAHVGNIVVYTNKVKNPAVRHVKVYRDNLTPDQLGALATFAGSKNVHVTYPVQDYPYAYGSRPGLIIRCMYDPYFE